MSRGVELAWVEVWRLEFLREGTGCQEVKREDRASELSFGPVVFAVNPGCPWGGWQTGGKMGLELSREKEDKQAVSKIISWSRKNRWDWPGKDEGREEKRAWGAFPASCPTSLAPAPSRNFGAVYEQLCCLALLKLGFSLSSSPVEIPFYTVFLLKPKGHTGFLSKTRVFVCLFVLWFFFLPPAMIIKQTVPTQESRIYELC